MSEDLDDWNPMSDDFESIGFNSYSSDQTAAHLPHNLVTTIGSKTCETRRPPKLYIDGFPSDLTENGLKNFLKRIGCKILTVKIFNCKNRFGRRFSFIDFESLKEAQKAVQLLRNQSLYKLSVNFATTQDYRLQREAVVEKENNDFQHLISKQLEMKDKINNGNCSSNGDSASLSPIHSESESHDSSHLDILSPLAKSDKLLKILDGPDDDCSFCAENQPIDHLHFILSLQQVLDPKQLPPLIDIINVCLSCDKKSVDMKLCSQCKITTYCDTKCQSAHWARHRIHCRQDSIRSLTLNSTQNGSINCSDFRVDRIDSNQPISRESEKVVQNVTKNTPQIKNTLQMAPKESTPIVSETRQSVDQSVKKSIPIESVVTKPNESVPVMKTAATKDSSSKMSKIKVTPIELPNMSIETESIIDGEQGVTVCYGRNPFDFYLQKASASDLMDILSEEISRDVKDFAQLSDNQFRVGTLCGGIYSVDGFCYRTRIVSKVNDETYALYFIDYGNTESVTKKNIKVLPQKYFVAKAQAIRCSLDSIEPKNKVWSRESIELFGDSNDFSKVKIFEKTNEEIYKIDLINSKGETIRQKLSDKGFATLNDELSDTVSRDDLVKTPPPNSSPSKTPLPNSSPSKTPPPNSSPSKTPPPNSSPSKTPQAAAKSDSPVIVKGSPRVIFNKASIDEMSSSFVKPIPMPVLSNVVLDSYLDSLETNSEISLMVTNVLNSEEFQYYGTVFENQVTQLIQGLSDDYPFGKPTVAAEVGDIIVAQASDGDCYRSCVLSIDHNRVKVFMIDSGFVEDIDKNKIFKLDPKYETIPVFGVLFLPSSPATARLIELNQTAESVIDGTFIRGDDNQMFLKSNNNMIKIMSYKVGIKLMSNVIKDGYGKRDEHLFGDVHDRLPLRQLPLKKSIEALALYLDPNDFKIFYVAGDDEDCTKLMQMCSEYAKKFDDNIRVNPLYGNVYLVRSEGDKDWYRAIVEEVSREKIRVKYIDFGNVEELDHKYVMELTRELQVDSIKPLAIKCRVESTKLSDDELKTKIEQATEGTYLLKIETLAIEDSIHLVKVK